MYQYIWDPETGGLLLTTEVSKFSKEPRPVYYKELDILGFDRYWKYPKDDHAPLMWAEANNYIYKGRTVARTKGGSLYTAPELILLDDPEPDGEMLQFVDIDGMVEKNRDILETLAQETIQKVYNTYLAYKDKVDVFYVAFSGGKDSVVALDIVQRALPHDAFKVMFGNTDMEFPTTLSLAEKVRNLCMSYGIEYYEARAPFPAIDSWNKFGPPARRVRWCCTVHKTAPVINKLCDIYGLEKLHAVMITGVRGDESSTRATYDELSVGKKLSGQVSYHPILDWSSAEVYLYIYAEKLLLNDAYKFGFNRVGCIMCPNSSDKHEFIKRQCFKEKVDTFSDIILATSKKDLAGENAHRFLETGGWKTRLSGRELVFAEPERFEFEERKNQLIFYVHHLNPTWKTWYKTIGKIDKSEELYRLEFKNVWRECSISIQGSSAILTIKNPDGRSKNSIEFIYLFKAVLSKAQYCIQCMTCVAECPGRNITMEDGKLEISDKCTRCHACLKILNGCLYYNSIRGSKDMKNVKGVNRYLSVGVDADWIKQYAADQDYEPGNRKTDSMFAFLKDAQIVEKRKVTAFGQKIFDLGLENDQTWALMLCNLVYTPAFGWYVSNIPFNSYYDESNLDIDMADATKKARGEFWNSFKVILKSTIAFQHIGFGISTVEEKHNKNGEIKYSLKGIKRRAWENPDPLVILYSLYKFAEACGEYYQFRLSTLLDDDIERDGVSPTRIFGLSRETMIPILNGLTANYPDFISASFTLDLENITLRSDKKAQDVLELF